jgi:RNA polymerase sigma-70 factor (ECF subfamily)
MFSMTAVGAEARPAAPGAGRPLAAHEVWTPSEIERFYGLVARDLWAYLVATTGDRSLADDVAQESFVRLFAVPEGRVAFESDEHRRRYLYRIATNLVRDHQRASRRRPSAAVEEIDRAAGPNGVRGRTPNPAASVDVRRALLKMRPRERELLWLAHVEEHSHQEIAGVLGLGSSSVRVMLFRARRKLAELLGVATAATGGL